jgi:hypothetical protein
MNVDTYLANARRDQAEKVKRQTQMNNPEKEI